MARYVSVCESQALENYNRKLIQNGCPESLAKKYDKNFLRILFLSLAI